MSTTTTNLQLVKPEDSDAADIDVINANMDILDEALASFGSQFSNNAVTHRNNWRGKYLGTSVTSAQWTEISEGTFDDLYVGDYWTLSTTVSGTTYSRNWRIIDIDYYYNYGDTAFTDHHLCMVPDTGLYTAQMNTTNTTADGYRGSAMYTTNLATAITIATNVFGSSHVKTHREFFNDSVTNGYPSIYNSSTSVWGTTKICELMSEDQVYGHPHFRPGSFYYTGTNVTIPANHSVSQRQLAGFSLNPTLLCNRQAWWLKDVASSAHFCSVSGGGSASISIASDSSSVRPLVIIG